MKYSEVETIYTIVVEKKDLNYVSKVVSKFYRGWIKVSTEKSLKEGYVIEIKPGYGRSRLVNPKYVVEYAGARNLSSISPLELVRTIEKARARLRLTATYNKCFVLSEEGEKLYGLEPHPGYDMFFLIGTDTACLLKELGLENPPETPLVLRKFRGVHDIYSGPRIIGRLTIPDEGRGLVLEEVSNERYSNDFNLLLDKNKSIIMEHIRISNKIFEIVGSPDIVVVSFSGGKDSIVVLDLAIKYYGKNKVYPIYVDTGLEFPETIEYVSKVQEYYGIEVVKAFAKIDEAIRERGLPTKTNRWCTGLKTKAFKEKLEEITRGCEQVLVVVGDRDAESVSRSHRSPVRKLSDKMVEVAPIKQWSTAHVQLYMYLNKLPVNPLYEQGFYRIGCYVCPALRSLELYIMTRKLWNKLCGKEFIEKFLREKKWVE